MSKNTDAAACTSQPAPGATADEIDQFEKLLLTRRARQEELGAALLEVEDMRVEIANVFSLWMSIFGDDYLPCERDYERMLVAQAMVDELERDPTLPRAALEGRVSDRRDTAEHRLDRLRREAQLSSLRKLPPYFDIPEDEDALAASRHEAARLARQIWRIVHPDILRHHPALAQLSASQRAHLEELQRSLVHPREAECGFAPCQFGFDHRSPLELCRILGEVQAILGHPGEDLDLDELIVGDTAAEQIAWLKSDIELLQQGIADARSQLCQLTAEPEYAERRYQLAMPERHVELKEALRRQGAAYRRQAEDLEADLARRLGEPPAAGDKP